MNKPDPAPASATEPRHAGLRRLAHILDSAIPLPGGFRIGLDGLIGLIPGAGDVIGTLLSSYIVAQAYKLGASRMVLARMAGNIAVDTVVGVVPLVGDLFDFAWKANRRNIDLLDEYLAEPRETQRRSTLLVIIVTAGLLLLVIGALVLSIALIRWIWESLG